MASWDPEQYARFADERARPFHELVARIPTTAPVAVVDLGCGPGTLTATLAARYPDAAVLGIDASPQMLAAAAPLATPQLSFQLGDIAGWRPQRGSVDVIVANASLQWVPDHAALLPVLAAALDDGGTLAFQVPTGGPILDASVLDPAVPGPRGASPVREPAWYVRTLAGLGLAVDAWETTYYHVLPGDDPVLEWFSGTGLRPYFDALSGAALDDFRARVAAELRQRYPREPFGTILPFPRLFVVAHRP
ncbi:methyltransferase domain-containing protein [Dactylosporangium aurantiacum]|uniref:Methyltransferase domain-containing protein n=1 Tax=Dactylosporangium aurantiacum TaxID=35754 RepID=A0A9Q9MGK0_9ACTN|nr:methyltransferase domain-containing protein [Dactylosporangium aurantiacum]MDG6104782.1 methyltransferase domain-containing protein [Dactylosporangium aurantiacum]UWZ55659.1 methyltransferase domain-containing protein [Dactylosporangium aurantiacum]